MKTKKNKIFFSTFLLILLVGMAGCKKKDETATSGHRLILAADPYVSVIQYETDEFMSLYPDVKIEVRGVSTREAVVLLLNDSVQSIVIDRQFNEEEQNAIRQAAIKITENRIAEDGIAIVVHIQNPISGIRTESVRGIVTSTVKDWNQIAETSWSGGIDLVLTDKNSGMYELLQKQFFSVSKPLEPTTIMPDQNGVIQYVSTHPQSVGFVASSIIVNTKEQIKVIPVIVKLPEGIEKKYTPQQQEIFSALYPLHYSLYLYNTGKKSSVGVGFGALVLSNVGQKIIQNADLVPASIPYRTIQLQAE
jgi:phosphate transport system substrate-binding protein